MLYQAQVEWENLWHVNEPFSCQVQWLGIRKIGIKILPISNKGISEIVKMGNPIKIIFTKKKTHFAFSDVVGTV